MRQGLMDDGEALLLVIILQRFRHVHGRFLRACWFGGCSDHGEILIAVPVLDAGIAQGSRVLRLSPRN